MRLDDGNTITIEINGDEFWVEVRNKRYSGTALLKYPLNHIFTNMRRLCEDMEYAIEQEEKTKIVKPKNFGDGTFMCQCSRYVGIHFGMEKCPVCKRRFDWSDK